MDKKEILDLVKKYYQENLNPKNKLKTFEKGQRIPYAGRVYDEKELINLWTHRLISGLHRKICR